MSAGIGALAGALAKAQAEVEGAAKDRVNPHFKSSYATLASIWEACRGALSKYGVAVVQSPVAEGALVTVTTLLAHASGEWIRSSLSALARDATPQSIGSATTYLRRYGLASMVGIAPEDDDGQQAQPNHAPTPQRAPVPAPVEAEDYVRTAFLAINNSLRAIWPSDHPDDAQARVGWHWSNYRPHGSSDPAPADFNPLTAYRASSVAIRDQLAARAKNLVEKSQPPDDLPANGKPAAAWAGGGPQPDSRAGEKPRGSVTRAGRVSVGAVRAGVVEREPGSDDE